MDQQSKAKPEEKVDQPAELTNKDLEQVAGGVIENLNVKYTLKPNVDVNVDVTNFKK